MVGPPARLHEQYCTVGLLDTDGKHRFLPLFSIKCLIRQCLSVPNDNMDDRFADYKTFARICRLQSLKVSEKEIFSSFNHEALVCCRGWRFLQGRDNRFDNALRCCPQTCDAHSCVNMYRCISRKPLHLV